MPFDEQYFSTHTYKDVSFGKFSQYWWSNRFYATLARRHTRCGGRLLEIGSGLGHLVGQLEKAFQTFAADVNPWALQRSRQVAPRTCHAACSAGALPFATGSFDAILIKHVVEHLPDPAASLAEIGRLAAPGGVLILATPNLDSLLKPWKGERWIGYQDPTHISLKPPVEWLRLVEEAGFTVLKVISDGFWDVPYIRWIPTLVQKLVFGAPGGLQAITAIPFLPLQWGESMIVIAQKKSAH